MQRIIVQVDGGVAEVTHHAPDIAPVIVDWDDINAEVSSADDFEKRDEARALLEQPKLSVGDYNRAMMLIEEIREGE